WTSHIRWAVVQVEIGPSNVAQSGSFVLRKDWTNLDARTRSEILLANCLAVRWPSHATGRNRHAGCRGRLRRRSSDSHKRAYHASQQDTSAQPPRTASNHDHPPDQRCRSV